MPVVAGPAQRFEVGDLLFYPLLIVFVKFDISWVLRLIGIFVETNLDVFAFLKSLFVFISLPGHFSLDKTGGHRVHHAADLLNFLHFLKNFFFHLFCERLDEIGSRQGIHRVTQTDLIHDDFQCAQRKQGGPRGRNGISFVE